MKNSTLLILALSLLIVFILFEGCKKDSDPIDDIEEINLTAEMMTLSAIAYSAEASTNDTIKEYIINYLADSSLATGGKWELVWGPGISFLNANLAYVARNNTGETPAYAIGIRGTNPNSIEDILEDIDVFELKEFPYGMDGDSVCRGSMHGFNNILGAKDAQSNSTLEEYLKSISTSSKVPLYVTGHSQGGGLCPLMAYWITTHEDFKEKFICSTYGFAGPGWVNKSFRDNFLNSMPAGAAFNMYVNSLDLVPYGYANLPLINKKNIPVHVPFSYRLAISAVDSTLKIKGIEYYNIVMADSIGNFPITPTTPGGLTPADTTNWYNHWLGVEHNHNNYLRLLGAKPLNE